eukprot:813526-Amorphochlora_amoeboformis.AAC.1
MDGEREGVAERLGGETERRGGKEGERERGSRSENRLGDESDKRSETWRGRTARRIERHPNSEPLNPNLNPIPEFYHLVLSLTLALNTK